MRTDRDLYVRWTLVIAPLLSFLVALFAANTDHSVVAGLIFLSVAAEFGVLWLTALITFLTEDKKEDDNQRPY